jgi:hypothetical protein
MEIQPIIDRHVASMNLPEINHILQHYKTYLRIDLVRDLEKQKKVAHTESMLDFNDIFNTGNTDE